MRAPRPRRCLGQGHLAAASRAARQLGSWAVGQLGRGAVQRMRLCACACSPGHSLGTPTRRHTLAAARPCRTLHPADSRHRASLSPHHQAGAGAGQGAAGGDDDDDDFEVTLDELDTAAMAAASVAAAGGAGAAGAGAAAAGGGRAAAGAGAGPPAPGGAVGADGKPGVRLPGPPAGVEERGAGWVQRGWGLGCQGRGLWVPGGVWVQGAWGDRRGLGSGHLACSSRLPVWRMRAGACLGMCRGGP